MSMALLRLAMKPVKSVLKLPVVGPHKRPSDNYAYPSEAIFLSKSKTLICTDGYYLSSIEIKDFKNRQKAKFIGNTPDFNYVSGFYVDKTTDKMACVTGGNDPINVYVSEDKARNFSKVDVSDVDFSDVGQYGPSFINLVFLSDGTMLISIGGRADDYYFLRVSPSLKAELLPLGPAPRYSEDYDFYTLNGDEAFAITGDTGAVYSYDRANKSWADTGTEIGKRMRQIVPGPGGSVMALCSDSLSDQDPFYLAISRDGINFQVKEIPGEAGRKRGINVIASRGVIYMGGVGSTVVGYKSEDSGDTWTEWVLPPSVDSESALPPAAGPIRAHAEYDHSLIAMFSEAAVEFTDPIAGDFIFVYGKVQL